MPLTRPKQLPLPAFSVVNEVDYQQPGDDNAEFVEIKNVTNLPVNLSGYQLYLVNGAGTLYNSPINLSSNLGAGQYYVVCGNAANVINCNQDVSPDMDLLENGTPAAVAIWSTDANWVIDTVSYGDNTPPPYTEGSSGAPADNDTDPGLGISRYPDGVDTNQNNVDFSLRCITPGQANSSQSTNCSANPRDPPLQPGRPPPPLHPV